MNLEYLQIKSRKRSKKNHTSESQGLLILLTLCKKHVLLVMGHFAVDEIRKQIIFVVSSDLILPFSGTFWHI